MAYYHRDIARAASLTIYIEGDGLAWLNPSTPSSDPTPVEPMALQLALAQPRGNAAYLARPCQYVDASPSGCRQRYWTSARFASEVVQATDAAISALKTEFGAQRLALVGYSGGAAVAALVAQRRHDVSMLITVAGNLDPQAWTAHHQLSALSGSLSPVDHLEALSEITQWHFVGKRDQVVPGQLTLQFLDRLTDGAHVHRVIMTDFDHVCCWVDAWPGLYQSTQVP